MTRFDPDERDAVISAAMQNYIAGEFGINRITAILASCGLNATEINEIIALHRDAAFEAFQARNRKPVNSK